MLKCASSSSLRSARWTRRADDRILHRARPEHGRGRAAGPPGYRVRIKLGDKTRVEVVAGEDDELVGWVVLSITRPPAAAATRIPPSAAPSSSSVEVSSLICRLAQPPPLRDTDGGVLPDAMAEVPSSS